MRFSFSFKINYNRFKHYLVLINIVSGTSGCKSRLVHSKDVEATKLF